MRFKMTALLALVVSAPLALAQPQGVSSRTDVEHVQSP